MRYLSFLLFSLILNNFYFSQVSDINGHSYRTASIGNQNWMAENLIVDRFNNGVQIVEAKNAVEWQNACREKKPAFCYYNFNIKNSSYGKIYNWYVVSSEYEIAPKGWHVPSNSEWQSLTENNINIFNTSCSYYSNGVFTITPNQLNNNYFGPWHSNDDSTPFDVIIDGSESGTLEHCALGCNPCDGFSIRCVRN